MAMTPEEILSTSIQNLNTAEQLSQVYDRLSGILEDQNKSISSYENAQKIIKEYKKTELLFTTQIEKATKEIDRLKDSILDTDIERLKLLDEEVKSYQKQLTLIEQNREALEENSNIIEAYTTDLYEQAKSWAKQEFGIRSMSSYLMTVDKQIRTLTLNLGLSGNRAESLREQMYEATNAAQRFGASAQDIVEIQSNVNQLTGRANVFTEKQVANMVLIAKGTGLANQEAGLFVGNMLLLGSSVEDATKLIEDTVNETAKLGLNSSNVIRGLTANIGKLNNYRFQNGVEGLKKMVQSSEKFKFSIDGAFQAADKFRTLEGLLEAGANLRVLGGEFAKMDEFKLSFLARNKPEEFAVEMAKLTKGMSSFNKTTGEFDVSDIDMDKFREVATLTGQEVGKLVESTKEMAKIDLAKSQIFVGDDADKEMIAKLASFGKGSTIGKIEIGGNMVRIDQLTGDHLEILRQTERTLKQRTEDSQTFTETFDNTIMQLKSTLLPILDAINYVLKGFNKIMDTFRNETTGKMNKIGLVIPAAILLLSTGIAGILTKMVLRIPSLLSNVLSKIPGLGNLFGKAASTATQSGSQLLGAGKGAMYKGFGSAATLAAIGVAAVGIGYGFKMAAEGAASLSESISKLTGPQLTALTDSLKTLGFILAGPLVVGVLALGAATEATALGLLAFGAAAVGVGFGIKLAAEGIGEMAKGFSTLGNVDLTKVGSGMLGIAGAALMLANPLGVAGLAAVGLALAGITALNFDNVMPLQNLKFIDADIKNMKMMVDLLNKINSIDTSKLDALGKLFSEGTMKVELVGSPTINNMITVDVDGEKFYKKVKQMIPIQIKKGVQPQGG
jgi:hypothetical protein